MSLRVPNVLTNFAIPNRVSESSYFSFPARAAAGDCLTSPKVAALQVPDRSLPLQSLKPFELVKEQFVPWGIEFEDAIALYPSNPAFIEEKTRLVLMPVASSSAIKIKLRQPYCSVTMRLRGYHDIRLATLNRDGHCTLCGKTFCSRYSPVDKAPLEVFCLDLRRVQTIVLKSSAPFILEAITF